MLWRVKGFVLGLVALPLLVVLAGFVGLALALDRALDEKTPDAN